MKKVIWIVTVCILAAVFCVSAFQVGSYFWESRKQANLNKQLSDIVQNAQQGATPTEPAEQNPNGEPTQPLILPGYAQLYEMNNDLVGWIRIEGTEIDYPVMQTPNAVDYYLRRDFNKEKNTRGCIYAREVCDVFTPSDNVTLYGHKMHDGSMFAALQTFRDREVWENNSTVFFDTLYEQHVYQIFAVFVTTGNPYSGFGYHLMVDAQSEEEFDEFIAKCKDLALYDTGITPEYGDKIICLSTCDYTKSNGRLVVVAKRLS